MSNGTQNYEEIPLNDKEVETFCVWTDNRSGSDLSNIFEVSQKMFMSTLQGVPKCRLRNSIEHSSRIWDHRNVCVSTL